MRGLLVKMLGTAFRLLGDLWQVILTRQTAHCMLHRPWKGLMTFILFTCVRIPILTALRHLLPLPDKGVLNLNHHKARNTRYKSFISLNTLLSALQFAIRDVAGKSHTSVQIISDHTILSFRFNQQKSC